MRKKIFAAFMAATVLSMGSMTVFAESPTVEAVEAQVATPAEVSLGTVTLAETTASTGFTATAISSSAATVQAAKAAVQNEILKDLGSFAEKNGYVGVANAAANTESKVTADILTVVDVKANATTPKVDGKYEVTLSLAGISAGDNIVVLHYNGTAWETIAPESVANGSVTFRSTTLSPVSIVKINVTTTESNDDDGNSSSESSNATATTTTTSLVTSPKTGEGTGKTAVILTIGAAGVAAVLKKLA